MTEIREIADILVSHGLAVSLNEPMSRHTTLRIGGAADCFATAQSEEQTVLAAELCRTAGVPMHVIGNGSDLLVADEGVRGVVLAAAHGSGGIERCGEMLHVFAGTALISVCEYAARASLGGLAFAAGIPGTVGGAVYMNAGAYGGEIADVLHTVRVLNGAGEISDYSAAECRFSYRQSRFQSERESIILSAVFSLFHADEAEIRGAMNAHRTARRQSQPLDMPNAGSAFRRPSSGTAAAAMIDACGLKGTAVGGAAVSEKHAGFIINRGEATCADVEALLTLIQKRVYEQYGVMLQTEYCRLGGHYDKA